MGRFCPIIFCLFITFWGILGITLYKLIPDNNEESSATAKKTLILIGASDSIMLIGIALIWRLTGSLSISETSLHTDNVFSCYCLSGPADRKFYKSRRFPVSYLGSGLCSECSCILISASACIARQTSWHLFPGKTDSGMFILNQWLTLTPSV